MFVFAPYMFWASARVLKGFVSPEGFPYPDFLIRPVYGIQNSGNTAVGFSFSQELESVRQFFQASGMFLLGIGFILILFRFTRRFAIGSCQGCGYDLQGSPNGICPECGEKSHAKKVSKSAPCNPYIISGVIPYKGGFIPMKRIGWLILIVVALCLGIAIGHYFVPRKGSGGQPPQQAATDRSKIQHAFLNTSFRNAVAAARNAQPAASAQAQRDFLAISEQMDDWEDSLVISTQRIAANTRLGIALDKMDQPGLADQAFSEALGLAQSLAGDPELHEVWIDKDSEQTLVAWITEIDSR